MKQETYNYRKGLLLMLACYSIWGFQPLYFALDRGVDTVFLLACRIVWAAIACVLMLKVRGKLPQLLAALRDKQMMKRIVPASVLLLADWSIYLFAVRSERVMECSMGYYIMPLVMFTFGALIFHEKISWKHFVALAFIVVGIILSAGGFGGFPYVTILLSLCFAVYSALKKSLTLDSAVSTTAEIVLMVPFALIYLVLFGFRENALVGMTLGRQLFAMGSGVVTALPMLLFALGVVCLPLSLTGIFQYISPTLGLICSMILGETFSREKLISFIFIWIGVIIYAVSELRQNRKAAAKGKE